MKFLSRPIDHLPKSNYSQLPGTVFENIILTTRVSKSCINFSNLLSLTYLPNDVMAAILYNSVTFHGDYIFHLSVEVKDLKGI